MSSPQKIVNDLQAQSTRNSKPQTMLQLQQQRGIQHYFSPTANNKSTSHRNQPVTSTNHLPQMQQQYHHQNGPNQLVKPIVTTASTSGSGKSYGGSTRVQQNTVNSNSNLGNGIHKSPSHKIHTRKEESKVVRSATPDSTTEPPPPPSSRPEKSFKEGDDVLYSADDGSFLLGTVGMIHGQTLQILFGDGTQQWASFKKVKNFSNFVADEEEPEPEPEVKEKPKIKHKTTSSDTDQPGSSEEVTCGSCGTVKKVAGKKALSFHPYTSQQFNCRRCLNKSTSFNKNSMIIPSQSRGKTNQSISSVKSTDQERVTGETSRRSFVCFHCKGKTTYSDRLHCNLCERACHLSCLAISPTPLEGDRFWDVICSACGTQNGESGSVGRSKVFSCRRSISSWSDVAHLVLSCLGIEHSEKKFFDLDLHVIPFIDAHLDRLHLPRSYKNTQQDNRKMFLNTALNNAKLRFLNGKNVNEKHTLWAIRDNNNHQGYPFRLTNSSSSAAQSTLISTKVPTPQPSPPITVPPVNSSLKSRLNVASNVVPMKVQPRSAFAATSQVLSKIIPMAVFNTKSDQNGSNSTLCSNSSKNSSIQHETGFPSEGSSRTLGKSSVKASSPQGGKKLSGPGSGSTSSLEIDDQMLDPLALDSAVEQSCRSVPKRIEKLNNGEATSPKKGAHQKVGPSPTEKISSGNNNTAASIESNHRTDRSSENTDPESDSAQSSKNILNSGSKLSQKRKLSPCKTFEQDMESNLKTKKQKLVLDLPNRTSPVKDNAYDAEFSESEPILNSPIANKMSSIFKNLNGDRDFGKKGYLNLKTSPAETISNEVSSKASSPTSSDKSSNAGKAVKTASVTPPGTFKQGKPSLRARKPKALQVLIKDTKKELSDISILKKNGALLKKQPLGLSKGRGRGRPLGKGNYSGANNVQAIGTLSELNGDGMTTQKEYSLMNATVEDLIEYGTGFTLHCLPTLPKSGDALTKMVSNLFSLEDKPSPPSFWKSDEKCIYRPWQKSKKDLKNLDSYEVTGRMVDKDGNVKYMCSWKDGYGNDSDEEDDGPYYEISEEDVDNLTVLLNAAEPIEVKESMDETGSPEVIITEVNKAEEVLIIPKKEPLDKQSRCLILPKFNKHKNNSPPSSSRVIDDAFQVSGLGLKKDSKTKPPVFEYDDVIDLTSDSP